MNISVIGCGRWGSFIAWYLSSLSYNVTLYGRSNSKSFEELQKEGRNEYITLSENMDLTSSLKKACKNKIIIISIDSQNLRGLCEKMSSVGVQDKIIILCMKGLEIETGLRLSQVAESTLPKSNKIAVWIGPGHVQDFKSGIPSCMVIDSKDENITWKLIDMFSSKLIRFYYGSDIVGNEIGAALKNVIGVAAGMLDGLGLSSLKGSLMTRGTKEVARLIEAMGGNPLSAYGLCHLGDYEATLFSRHSHNRQFGECYVTKDEFSGLAEGFYTAKAVMHLCEKYDVEMPICRAVYDVLYGNTSPKEAVSNLFDRDIKTELQ